MVEEAERRPRQGSEGGFRFPPLLFQIQHEEGKPQIMSSKKVTSLYVTYDNSETQLRGNKFVDVDFDTKGLERSVTAAQLNKFFNLPKSRRESGEESISVRNNGALQRVHGLGLIHTFDIIIHQGSGELSIGCKTFSEQDTATIKRWAKRVVTASKATKGVKTSSSKQQAA